MNDVTSANEAKLVEAFRTSLELEGDADVAELVYQGIDAWDSVGHMVLVANLEEAFDVMLETDDVIDMSSFAAARTILARYGVSF
jgi:acyl carrier protein